MKSLTLIAVVLLHTVGLAASAEESLPSWNDNASRSAIVAFVDKVTTYGTPDFVPASERIAVFDNDGTLWAEQPVYFQLLFAIDRIRELAPSHPEWEDSEPFASVLTGDFKAALAGGEKALLELVLASHSGMSTEEFSGMVSQWLATKRHPTTDLAFTDMVYEPMLELLEYLRGNGFKTFIVSGGGVGFMRPWSEETYGIPPEQVVGSRVKTQYEVRDGEPVIIRLPKMTFIDDKAGKPVGINEHIGQRPIMAVGNSDGDFEMLEWTTAGSGPRLGVLIHHTDAVREWAYDRDSHIGKLSKGLDEAAQRGWVLVDMKADWKTMFKAGDGAAGWGPSLFGLPGGASPGNLFDAKSKDKVK